MKHKWKKILKPLLAGSVFAILVYTGVRAYQSGDVFTPSDKSTDIVQNRVVFPNKENHENLKDSSGNSDLWEKDREKQNKIDKDEMPDSAALFEQMKKSKSSGQNNYVNDTKGKKVSVQLNENSKGKNQGKIKIQKEGSSGQVVPTNTGDKGQTETNPKSDNPSADGTGGSTPSAPKTPSENKKSDGGGDDESDKKPSNTDKPSASPRPTPTRAPKAPEKPPTIPKGDSLIEGLYPNISEFPETGTSDSDGQLKLYICPIFDMDRTEYVYYNAELTAEKLLCSVLVYVMNEKNQVLYRITKYGENFQIGEFPAIAKNDFTVKFRFRENTSALWKEFEYEYTVLPYKYFVLNEKEDLVGEETPAAPKINLLSYYKELLAKEEQNRLMKDGEYPLNQIVSGFKDAVTGQKVSDQYTAKEKGWRSFKPDKKKNVPDGYEAKLKWYVTIDNFDYCANLKYLQTLTKIPQGTTKLDVMEGIHWVDLEGVTVKMVKLSESTAVISLDQMVVTDAFELSEKNPYFSVQENMLLNQDKTYLIGIPSAKQEVQVPQTVTRIDIPKQNAIRKMEFSSKEPPEIDLSNLSQAILWVPNEYYDAYYTKWTGKLPNSVRLMRENGEKTDYVIKDGAIFSQDGIVLYKVLNSVKGNYIVPDGVRVIKKDAFSECDNLYRITIPSAVEDLEEDSLKAKNLREIAYLGDEVPLHAGGKFAPDVPVLVKSDVYQKWPVNGRPSGLRASLISLRNKEGFYYLEEDGTTILLQVPKNLVQIKEKTFDESVDVIGSGAFDSCDKLFICEFPASVKKIEAYAFADCSALQGLLFDSTDNITVQKDAYMNCGKIRFTAYNAMRSVFEEDYLPHITAFSPKDSTGYPQAREIPYGTFQPRYGSTFFLEGSVAEGMYLYSDFLFNGEVGTYLVGVTDNVKGALKLRSDIREIIFDAFNGCSNTFTIDFTKYKDLFAIDERCFFNSGLSGDIVLPDTVRELSIYAFAGCVNITSVELQNEELKEIPMYLFAGCTSLKKISFAKDSQLEKIGVYAFSHTAIETFELPQHVQTVYDNIFSYCEHLLCMKAYGKTPADLKVSEETKVFTFGNYINKDFYIEVLPECEDIYKEKWSAFSQIIRTQ